MTQRSLLIYMDYLGTGSIFDRFLPLFYIDMDFDGLRRDIVQVLEGYTGVILLVEISYDKNNKNKPHSCVVEKLEKRLSY